MQKKADLKAGVIVLALVLALAFMPSATHAMRGVGIKWYTEAEIVPEESTRCISYGIYNPWDTDINAVLRASDEFMPIVEKQESETVFVAAGTSSSAAIPNDICFTIGDIYEEDCLLAGLFCERKCPSQRVEYQGHISAESAPSDNGVAGTGSSTRVSVATTLRLIAGCVSAERDLTPLYYGAGIAAGVVAIVAVKRRRARSGKAGKKKGRRKPHIIIKI